MTPDIDVNEPTPRGQVREMEMRERESEREKVVTVPRSNASLRQKREAAAFVAFKEKEQKSN